MSIEETQEAKSLDLNVSQIDAIGWLLVGSGFASLLILLVKGYRKAVGWLVPVGLVGAGAAILLQERQSRISAAEEKIMAELDTLDPVGRAQILAKLADREISTFRKPAQPDK